MAEGFRPGFYKDDPKLHSIELLEWASQQLCFTSGDMQSAFSEKLASFKDPVHEISERLRKLVNSGMIVAVDQARYDSIAPFVALGDNVKHAITERAGRIAVETKGKRGRPPRIYIITTAGAKQVGRRGEDLDIIKQNNESKGVQ